MTAVLSPTDLLRKERYMSLDDNGVNYSTGSTDWRAKYNEVVDMLAETRAELDEFHHASKELEAELENELQRTEKAQQDLKVKVSRAESEREEWKSKFMSLQTTHNTTTTSLQRELDKLRQEYQQTKVQLRELEMGNDDLERNERAVSSSLADMEAKYSRALEEKILLEQELLEKANLEEETQRLKDDLRDANEEVSILKDQLTVTAAAASGLAQSLASQKRHKAPSDEDLLKTAPPSDLDLSELCPSSESLPSQTSTPKASTSIRPSSQSALQRVGLYNKDSPLSTTRAAGFTRSSTLASFYSPTASSSRVTTVRATPVRSSTTTSSQASTATTGTTSKNKGVQMVSEMRARVRNLEQKIHTRVPRLRMVSITGRTAANTATPSSVGTPSGSSSSSASNPSTAKTSWESHRKSSDSRKSTDSFDKHSRKDTGADSSGWVLIMEDSPSPQKDKERERQKERRRLSNPAAPTAFRPTVSTNRAISPSLSIGIPNTLAQSTINTGLRRPQSRLSGASSTTGTTGSSIPTPISRPATPTFLPLPTGGLYAPTSSGFKRSTGPNAPNPYNQTKRSSLGTSTMGPPPDIPRDRPTTMPPLPRSNSNALSTPAPTFESNGKDLPQIPGLHANVTMRPPKLPSTSNLKSVLSKSRIGRPSSSGRKSAGDTNGALDVKELRPRAGSSAVTDT